MGARVSVRVCGGACVRAGRACARCNVRVAVCFEQRLDLRHELLSPRPVVEVDDLQRHVQAGLAVDHVLHVRRRASAEHAHYLQVVGVKFLLVQA